MFDDKYEALKEPLTQIDPAFQKLIFLNQELFGMIENQIALDLLTRMYSTQLVTKGEKHVLDYNRVYYKLLRQIAKEGQEKGELRDDISVNEIVKLYAMCERGLLYDWCLCNGDYSLKQYAKTVMPMFLEGIRKK